MRELQSKMLIVIKGLMFFLILAGSAALILTEYQSLRALVLLMLLVWSACRFYYFLFYVLEKYVDSNLRYAGLLALMATALRRKRRRGAHA
jgi:hypothetical protein